MQRSTSMSLVLGPLGSAAATFFWVDGRYGISGGTILVLAMVVWAHGVIGLLQALGTRMPGFASVGLPVALYAVMDGMAFGFQGFFEAVFDRSAEESLAALSAHPVAANLLLWLAGPMVPLSLVALGAVLGWRRVVPLWAAALLCVGGAAFPLSRIPRIELAAHLADAILVVAFAGLAWQYQTGRLTQPQRAVTS